MTKTLLLATSALLAFTVNGIAAAARPAVSSAGFGAKANPIFHRLKGAKMLYNQNSNNSGIGLNSQNFTSATYSGDSDADADDFIVPKGKGWKVGKADVTGVYFNGSGPATSENIIFYEDAGDIPGKAIKGGTYTGLSCADRSGSFACVLPKKLRLKTGHYWVSVVANLAFSKGGEWGWEGNTTIKNDQAMWEMAAFGSNCPTWGQNVNCLGYAQDDMFDLKS